MYDQFISLSDGSIFIPQEVNRYRALHGNERPDIGELGLNVGSFDIIPLLPNPIFIKGGALNLTGEQAASIFAMNPDGNGFTALQKRNWLVDEEGNKDVMAWDPDTQKYRIPSPGISGGAIVNVLKVVYEKFAMIECLCGVIPEALPDYLRFEWYGFGGTELFKPYGGVWFPVFFSVPIAYVPFKWLVKI